MESRGNDYSPDFLHLCNSTSIYITFFTNSICFSVKNCFPLENLRRVLAYLSGQSGRVGLGIDLGDPWNEKSGPREAGREQRARPPSPFPQGADMVQPRIPAHDRGL